MLGTEAIASFPRTCEFAIERVGQSVNSAVPVPAKMVWIHDENSGGAGDQLFLDQILVARHHWTYNTYRRSISWRGPWGGGILYFSGDGRSVNGMVGASCCQIVGVATAAFQCDVALKTGATPIRSGGTITGFSWNTGSSDWSEADWEGSRLKLSYTSSSGDLTLTFNDLKASGTKPSSTWSTSNGGTLELSSSSHQWVLNFTSGSTPAISWPSAPSCFPQSVFPLCMEAKESAMASSISGAMEVGNDPNATIIGFKGSQLTPALNGYYRTSDVAAPFGVFNDGLTVDAKPVARAIVLADRIQWSGLPESLQQRLGLREAGTLMFAADGIPLAGLQRLHETQLAAAIAQHADLYPSFHTAYSVGDAITSSPLTISGLVDMDPFLVDQHGNVFDAITASVSSDLFTIMNSQVPASLWENLFPHETQPTLSSFLSLVANTPATGFPDPLQWYQWLSTAVVTDALAKSSESPCQLLNGIRANAWLQGEVAKSPVYQKHSQLLMASHWKEMFSSIDIYLNDQETNQAYYSSTASSNPPNIQYFLSQDVADIQALQVSSSATTQLTNYANAAANYATLNKLYWAFAVYRHATSDAFLANVDSQLQSGDDSSYVFTLIQQLTSTLAMLDPSGQMAAYYNQELNVFLGTTAICRRMDPTQGVVPDSVVTNLLYNWVLDNLNSDISSIKEQAFQLSQLLEESNYKNKISTWLGDLRASAMGVSQWSRVVQRFVNTLENQGFNTKVANVIASTLSLALTGLNLYCLYEGFAHWNDLSTGEQVNVSIGAAELISRGAAGLAVSGGQAWDAFNLSKGACFGRWARICLVKKYACLDFSAADISDQLTTMVQKTAAANARWYISLSDAAQVDAIATKVAMLMPTTTSEEVSVLARIFGGNLSEFMANRLGPAFGLASVALSIYFLTRRPTGLALGSDILGLISGAIGLFAMVGTMFAVEGTMLATACSVAGPLSIVAAIAGIILVVIELKQSPPNPYANFVDGPAEALGFTVKWQNGAIDYAVAFTSTSGPQRTGLTLDAGGQFLLAGTSGSISIVSPATALPDCVWQAVTDGLGVTEIFTVLKPTASSSPSTYYLTLTTQNTIVFQSALPSSPAPIAGQLPTQKWLSTVTGNVETVGGENGGVFLNSLDMMLQPVLLGSHGYTPSGAKGYLMLTNGEVIYSSSPATPTQFTLQTAGMAPNFLHMSNLSFAANALVGGT